MLRWIQVLLFIYRTKSNSCTYSVCYFDGTTYSSGTYSVNCYNAVLDYNYQASMVCETHVGLETVFQLMQHYAIQSSISSIWSGPYRGNEVLTLAGYTSTVSLHLAQNSCDQDHGLTEPADFYLEQHAAVSLEFYHRPILLMPSVP